MLLRPAFGGLDCFAARQCGLGVESENVPLVIRLAAPSARRCSRNHCDEPLIFGYPIWMDPSVAQGTELNGEFWRKTSARKSINTVVFVVGAEEPFTWLKTDVRRKYVESVGLGSIMSPSLFLKIDIPLTCCSAKNLGPTQFNRFSERASGTTV